MDPLWIELLEAASELDGTILEPPTSCHANNQMIVVSLDRYNRVYRAASALLRRRGDAADSTSDGSQ